MPTMAAITVKKNDGVTDIVYDVLTPSPGDNSPAVWRQDTGALASLPVGLRALISLLTKWNGSRTARQCAFKYIRPYAVQNSTTGLWASAGEVVISGMATVPQGLPSAEIDEAISQGCNAVAHALIKQSMKSGYAPS